MANLHIEFDKIENVTLNEMIKGEISPGHEYVNVHMIFDIKMDINFTRNETLVDDGHTTVPSSSIAYSRGVSRDIVGVACLYASLKYLEILACIICNGYINTKCREKCWTEVGTDFETKKGMTMILVKAITMDSRYLVLSGQ